MRWIRKSRTIRRAPDSENFYQDLCRWCLACQSHLTPWQKAEINGRGWGRICRKKESFPIRERVYEYGEWDLVRVFVALRCFHGIFLGCCLKALHLKECRGRGKWRQSSFSFFLMSPHCHCHDLLQDAWRKKVLKIPGFLCFPRAPFWLDLGGRIVQIPMWILKVLFKFVCISIDGKPKEVPEVIEGVVGTSFCKCPSFYEKSNPTFNTRKVHNVLLLSYYAL